MATSVVTGVNDAPNASNNTYIRSEDTRLVVVAPGVLGNDSDPDGDALSAALYSNPAHGDLSFSANGSFIFTPTANFNGADSFIYVASDGVLTDTAVVNLRFNPVNDAPLAAGDAYTATEDIPLVEPAPGVLGNDDDVDGDSLTAVVDTPPANGSLALALDGSFVYTPTANYNGSDSFSYTLSDGSLTDIATVTLSINPVNDAPVLAPIGGKTVDELTTLVFTATATDGDGDGLTYTLDVGSVGSLDAATGRFEWMPTEAQGPGQYSATLRVSDGQLEGMESITLTVNEVNTAPAAFEDNYIADQGTVLNVPVPGVLDNDNDTDLPVQSLTAGLHTAPVHGSLMLAADGSFVYTPTLNFFGLDSFAYVASDGTLTDTATVMITVNQVSTYTLTYHVVGSGTVVLDPAGGVYNAGSVVTLTAVPEAGWQFAVWSGDTSGSVNPITITMDSNKTITATFRFMYRVYLPVTLRNMQ